MDLAQNQGVAAVAFGGVERLPKEQLPPVDILMYWLGQANVIESESEDRSTSAKQLAANWHGCRLRMLALKGFALESYYPMSGRCQSVDKLVYHFFGAKAS